MRRTVDDVTSTPKAHWPLAFLTILVVMVTVFAPLAVATKPVDSSVSSSGNNNTGKQTILEMRVLYICDNTSEQFCIKSSTSHEDNQSNATKACNTKTTTSPIHGRPKGCTNIAPSTKCPSKSNDKTSTDSKHNNVSSDTHDFDNHTKKNHDSRFQCWQLADGGVLIERKLSNDSKDVLRTYVSYRVIGGTMVEKMRALDLLNALNTSDVIVAIGDSVTVQVAAIAGDWRKLPVLGYITSSMDDRKSIQGRTFMSLNPDPEAQGRALTQVIGQYNMKQTAVLVEETRLADGFLSGVRQVINTRRQDIFFLQSLATNDTSDDILNKLVDISTVGWKVVLLHTSPSLMLRVVTAALSTRLYKTGHAWFLSEAAYTRDPDILRQLPDGLLAVDSFWLGGIPDVMTTSLERILETVTCLLLSQSNSVPYTNNTAGDLPASESGTNTFNSSGVLFPNEKDNDRLSNLNYLKTKSHNGSSGSSINTSNSSNDSIRISLSSLRSSLDFADTFKRCLRQVTHYSCKIKGSNGTPAKENDDLSTGAFRHLSPSKNNFTKTTRGKHYNNQTLFSASNSGLYPNQSSQQTPNGESRFPSDRFHWPQSPPAVRLSVTKCENYSGPAFFLVNTIRDANGELMWSKVGYITASGDRDLKTVLWPGHNIYGPSSNMVKTYRVVTRLAEPFIFITRQNVSAKEDCYNNVPCLRLENSSKALVDQVVEDFVTHQELAGKLYSLHCCKGLSLEMLDQLSVDLNFRYVLYFVNDTDYGTLRDDGAWTGMVGDIINDVADVVIGAFSMTATRMSAMDFTEPFYKNEFALVTGEDGHYVSIWAFMSPFSGQVWLCIMLSSIVAGIATSILEWHSPFGLNPRGRKRTKNYGLGSGLLMVMVLLTGHTINIKAPKSWPSKVIQNVWAGLAIFIMTSYTANLAAYLAGQSVVTTVNSVFDPELLTKKVSVIPSSAVEYFVDRIHPKLGAKAKLHPVSSTYEALDLLKRQKIDVYMDDMPLLEYALARYDDTCNLRFAGKGFGSDGYAFGLPRFSWLKIPMSNQIRRYAESGYIQELSSKYLSRPRCENFFLVGTANPYGLEHTGGLFIILVSAVLLSVVFLLLEHLAYHYLVPWLRRQPVESFWKRESFGFISQRVFRVVRSERLYSQKQAAQEMIKIVKQRDFTRLIQKNELQKRRMPTQKRVKTKAEVFQEITANIVSYHRQMQSASEDPETIEGSDLDEEYLNRGESETAEETTQVGLTVQDGIQNVAFSAGSSNCSTVGSRRRRGYKTHNMLSIDDDDNVVFMDDNIIEEESGDFWAGPKRHGSSRSFIHDPRNFQQQDTLRKFSDPSYHPSWKKTHKNPYVLPISSRYRRPSLTSFEAPISPSVTPGPSNSGNIQNNVNFYSRGNGQSLPYANNSSNIFSGNGSVTSYTLQPLPVSKDLNVPTESGEDQDLSLLPHQALVSSDLPPETPGRDYYYSPSSSSIQTLGEERREFSPLSSPTTPHTDEDFPACIETLFTTSMSLLKPAQITAMNPSASGHHHLNQGQGEPKSPTKQTIRLDPVTLSSAEDLLQPSRVPEKQAGLGTALETQVSPKSNSKTFSPATLEIDQFSEGQHAFGHGSLAFAEKANGSSNLSKEKRIQIFDDRDKPFKLKRNRSAVFTIEEHPSERRGLSSRDNHFRRASLDSEYIKNNRKPRVLGDYLQRKNRVQDNRVKSSHDSPGMSKHHRHLAAVDHIDKGTLEALSKEDVLILWRKSELDLEARLQEVLARNRRLNIAIDYLTGPGDNEQTEDV